MKHKARCDAIRLDKVKIQHPVFKLKNGELVDVTNMQQRTHKLEYCDNILYNLDNLIKSIVRRYEQLQNNLKYDENVNDQIVEETRQLTEDLIKVRESYASPINLSWSK